MIVSYWLFIKPGKQERGTERRECGKRGECSLGFRGISYSVSRNVTILIFWGMFQRIPGNVEEDSGECSRGFWRMFYKIPGNVRNDPGECSKRFHGMFEEIPGNVWRDSRTCSKRFWRMLKKILGNAE